MSRTLRDLVHQSVMLSFAGPTVTPDVLATLTLTRAAGFILFADNIESPAQLYDLNRTLQAHAANLGLPLLLIAIDQEGGIVSRLPNATTLLTYGDPAVSLQALIDVLGSLIQIPCGKFMLADLRSCYYHSSEWLSALLGLMEWTASTDRCRHINVDTGS